MKTDESPQDMAISFANQFVDAGVAKLDALFGAGYAKANPEALQAYLTTCSANLSVLLDSALALTQYEEALNDLDPFDEEIPPPDRRS